MSDPVCVGVPLDQLRTLLSLLEECSQDLRVHVEAEYPADLRSSYPTYERRYRRDINPVEKAEALTGEIRQEFSAALEAGPQVEGDGS